MRPHRSVPGLPLLAIALLATALSSCADGSPLDPTDALAFPDDQPLATVLPDLAPEPGSAATDRYVPTLHRVLRRAVHVIREKRGVDAAAAVTAEVQRLQAEVRAAKEAGDKGALKEAVGKLDGFAARVGVKVFGPRLAGHVAADAAAQLRDLMPRLKAAAEAGQDVGRLVEGARGAQKALTAAKEARDNEKWVPALVLAARALDTVAKISALAPTT